MHKKAHEFAFNTALCFNLLLQAAKGPCILVFIGGGCVDMTAFKARLARILFLCASVCAAPTLNATGQTPGHASCSRSI